MANRSDEDNDLTSLALRPSTRPPLMVSSRQPEQVIVRSDKRFDYKNELKKENVVDIDKLYEMVYKWPNWDVWPFKAAMPIVAAGCAGTGFFLNHTFRKALVLEHFSRMSSYVGMMGVPAFACALFHGLTVSASILQQDSRCPVCIQVRSAVVQLVFGLAVPIVTAPMVSYSTAAVLKDVHFPNVKKHPREVLDFTRQIYKPIRGQLGVIGAAQVLLAMGVTYIQQECFYNTILPVLQGKTIPVEYPGSVDQEAKEKLNT